MKDRLGGKCTILGHNGRVASGVLQPGPRNTTQRVGTHTVSVMYCNDLLHLSETIIPRDIAHWHKTYQGGGCVVRINPLLSSRTVPVWVVRSTLHQSPGQEWGSRGDCGRLRLGLDVVGYVVNYLGWRLAPGVLVAFFPNSQTRLGTAIDMPIRGLCFRDDTKTILGEVIGHYMQEAGWDTLV